MINNQRNNVLRDRIIIGVAANMALWFGGAFSDFGPIGERRAEKRIVEKQGLESHIEQVDPVINFLPVSNDYSVPAASQDYSTKDFSRDSDKVLLARMLFGEARSCADEEKVAIAYTAINRANDGKKWNGESVREAILKSKQYSCFNQGNANREKVMNPMAYEPAAFEDCLEISERVLNREYDDISEGATHYFNPVLANPSWAKKMEKIGKIQTAKGQSEHIFYREK